MMSLILCLTLFPMTVSASPFMQELGIYQATDADFDGSTNGTFRFTGKGITAIEPQVVVIPATIKGVAVTSYHKLFSETAGANTSKVAGVISSSSRVRDMSYMFEGSTMDRLNLIQLETSGVTNMEGMFRASNIKSIVKGDFNTASVTNMNRMFEGVSSRVIDMSSFDTRSMISNEAMLSGVGANVLKFGPAFNKAVILPIKRVGTVYDFWFTNEEGTGEQFAFASNYVNKGETTLYSAPVMNPSSDSLYEAIRSVSHIGTNAVTGVYIGQYPETSLEELEDAVARATMVYNNSNSVQEDYDLAEKTLMTALMKFYASVNVAPKQFAITLATNKDTIKANDDVVLQVISQGITGLGQSRAGSYEIVIQYDSNKLSVDENATKNPFNGNNLELIKDRGYELGDELTNAMKYDVSGLTVYSKQNGVQEIVFTVTLKQPNTQTFPTNPYEIVSINFKAKPTNSTSLTMFMLDEEASSMKNFSNGAVVGTFVQSSPAVLEIGNIDITNLSTTLSEVKAFRATVTPGTTPGQYPQAEVDRLTAKIAEADRALTNTASSQSSVDKLVDELNSITASVRSSVILAPSKTGLETRLTQAEELSESSRLRRFSTEIRDGIRKTLTKPIADAKTVINNDKALEADITKAISDLTVAINVAEKKIELGAEIVLAEELEDLIIESETDLTRRERTKLVEAIDSAIEVIAKETARVSEVEDELNELYRVRRDYNRHIRSLGVAINDITIIEADYELDRDKKLITKIPRNTTVTKIKNSISLLNVSTATVRVFDNNGKEIQSSAFVGTGHTVRVSASGADTLTYTLVIDNDVTGDGMFDKDDTDFILAQIARPQTLSPAVMAVADRDGNGRVTLRDLVLISRDSS